MRKEVIIVVIVVIVIIVFLPIPHDRIKVSLAKSFNANRTVYDNETIRFMWQGMEGDTNIKVLIQSSEDIQLVITGIDGKSDTFYNSIQRNHGFQYTSAYPTYNLTIMNPPWTGDGSRANMLGRINAYHVYSSTDWIPWWM